ncbi:tetratricopeptide repeat protein [Mucilaginibacter boryungensis]|uniref:Tetratricopeptide repeat protein n=1 Tax=Mucilaginibacter boryungensis TaxID=768480 RepID=A0ABR9XET7_9SPHI|nr:tetratricopeptide repeat protein [Mucilaginibacter boryungensis]MBE9665589.1 tetratricopeptide repeat protein [Mucilaginibacter boryungensis]
MIITFHELGHAVAYLFLTRPDRIDVFIGSYGNKTTKIKFRINKLHFYIKPSFLPLRGGQCQSSKIESDYRKFIIILIAGPLFSFLLSCLLGYIVMSSDLHGAIKLYFFALMLASFMSFCNNLRPYVNKVTGNCSDGKQLQFTYKARSVYREYINGANDFTNKDFQSAKINFLKVMEVVPYETAVIRAFISSLLMLKNNAEAEIYLIRLKETTEFTIIDYLNYGYIQSVTKRSEEAVDNYLKALAIDANNLVGLNNLGYEYIMKEDFADAQKLLEKAISIDPNFAHPYSNLGFLKLLNGDLETGRSLIEKGIELDPNNAYMYKHLGVYYLKSQNKEAATLNFNKAKELDKDVDLEPYQTELALLYESEAKSLL